MHKTKSYRVGIYVRLSVDRDKTKESPARQRKDCTELAVAKGWQVVNVYEDRDESAYSDTAKRPEYQRMLADIKSGFINGIVVWKLDRLGRRVTKVNEVVALLVEHDAVLASVNEQIDTSTPIGQAMVGFMAALAQGESESISLRVARAVETQISNGKMPSGRCFGYSQPEGTIIASEAKIIRSMAAQYLAGTTLRQIALGLNRKGVRSTKDGLWTSKTVNQLLRSPRLGGYRLGTDKRTLVQGAWKPILDGPTFTALQSALEGARKPAQRPNVATHLLSGIATCGRCGATLKPLNWKQPHAGGKAFPRLCCLKDVGKPNCGGLAVTEAGVNKVVRFDMIDHVFDLHRASNRQPDVDYAGQLDADRKALEELVMARFVDRSIDQDTFVTAKAALEDRITMTEQAMSMAAVQRPQFVGMKVGEIDAWWEGSRLEEQRALIRSVAEKVIVHPAKHRGGNVFDRERIEIVWREPQSV